MRSFRVFRLRRISRRFRYLLLLVLVCLFGSFALNSFLMKSTTKLSNGSIEKLLANTEIVHSEITKIDPVEVTKNKSEIIILRYTKYFGHYEVEPVLTGNDCKYLQDSVSFSSSSQQTDFSLFDIPCRTTFDRKYLKESDALVFHSHDLEREDIPRGPRNDTNQIWIYLQQESPIHTGLNLEKFDNTFNWTMTQRSDSDVCHPYGVFVQRPNINQQASSDLTSSSLSTFTNKTGLVAWIVSNCDTQSKRQNFVYELQKYISVDIFGWCGKECPSKDCYKHVSSNYKFYLSFENSLCTDYITEKFFKPLTLNTVPIVYGGGVPGNDYTKIAPVKSYVDARSFNSPRNLANYLLYLDQNDEEYLNYFEWKKYYQVFLPKQGYWCNLCQRVYEHLNDKNRVTKWYKDLNKWWWTIEETRNDLVPSCASPPEKLTDFNPGFLKRGDPGKFVNWARKKIFKE